MTPTPTDYIILAYLADGPQHGYSLIEKLTQDNLQSVASFSVPNIYTALRRLYRSGAIGQKIRKIRNRPDQKIYSINESGREILAGFLEDENILRQQTRFRPPVSCFRFPIIVSRECLGLNPVPIIFALSKTRSHANLS